MSMESMIKTEALKVFDQVGFAASGKPSTIEYYESWLQDGMHGKMSYLAKHLAKKANPDLLLKGARSWIVLILNYDTREPLSTDLQEEFKRDKKGWIARFARGRDYHFEIQDRHHKLIKFLKEKFPGEEFLGSVDFNAVLERDAAAQAGVGWIGKNTCLINKDLGSFVFISEILTTLELQPDRPVMDHCGTCNRCIEACPTGAIVEPRKLDATKCISYWTIESKSPAPPALASKFGANVYGCDICQDVCPWNKKARRSNQLPEAQDFGFGLVDLTDVVSKGDDEIKLMLHQKDLNRTKPSLFRVNSQNALKNLAKQFD